VAVSVTVGVYVVDGVYVAVLHGVSCLKLSNRVTPETHGVTTRVVKGVVVASGVEKDVGVVVASAATS
jgi:hypothetical protein